MFSLRHQTKIKLAKSFSSGRNRISEIGKQASNNPITLDCLLAIIDCSTLKYKGTKNVKE